MSIQSILLVFASLAVIASIFGWVSISSSVSDRKSLGWTVLGDIFVVSGFLGITLLSRFYIIPFFDSLITEINGQFFVESEVGSTIFLLTSFLLSKGVIILSVLLFLVSIRKLWKDLALARKVINNDINPIHSEPYSKKLGWIIFFIVCLLIYILNVAGYSSTIDNVSHMIFGVEWLSLAKSGPLFRILFFFLVIITFFFSLLRTPRNPVAKLTTSETHTKIVMIYLLLLVFWTLTSSGAVMAIASGLSLSNVTRIVLGAVLLFTIPAAIAAQLLIKPILKKGYQIDSENYRWEFKQLEKLFLEASDRVGATRPHFWISKLPFLSPQVFGSFTSTIVIFPINYWDILRSLRQRISSDLVENLHQFIVNHELTHLENEDHRLFTWLGSYLRILLTFWLPLYMAIAATNALNVVTPENLFLFLHFVLILPILNLGLIYLLTLSIMRDRELLADQRAFQLLSTESRTALLNPTVRVGNSKLSPLRILMQMFIGQHSTLLGLSISGDYSFARSSAFKRKMSTILRRLSLITGFFFKNHPSSERREFSLTQNKESTQFKHSERESGIFAGAVVGLLLCYWGSAIRVFGSEPSNQMFLEILLLTTGILTALLYMPVKSGIGKILTFVEFERSTVFKLVIALISCTVIMIIWLSPILSLDESVLLFRISLNISLGAYVFWLMILMLSTASRQSAFQAKELIKMAVHLIFGLIVMGIFFS